MSDRSNDWVGQTLSGGRYRVDAKLGEGGMGFVYKVWDRNLDTDVVVKAPRKSMLDDPEFGPRFALEIRSLVKLSHPNIVKVSDVGEHERLPFAVMQYLPGGTLDERLDYGRDGRPLPASPASVSSWLPGMAAALDFIHGKGYIHRDVKPANILFDTHGHPYLSDFGVAKVLSDVEASAKKGPSGMTGIGIVLGTPEYMAPELIMGNAFDGKVDQYALAATAYEILCGRKPFTGDTATAIIVRQTTQDPPPLAELPTMGAEAISRVILKGLAKKPGDRFATCVDFANALVAALAKAGTARPAVAPAARLACPSCGVGFAATADLANFKGKKSKCQACGKPFRIATDGLRLERIDPDAQTSPSGSVEVPAAARQPSPAPRADRTVKLEAMPNPDLPGPATPARAGGTMKIEAMPNPPRPVPSRASGTRKIEALPAVAVEIDDSPSILDDRPEKPSSLPWVLGGLGLAVAATAVFAIVLATRPTPEPADLLVTRGEVAPVPIKSTPSRKPPLPTIATSRTAPVVPQPSSTPATPPVEQGPGPEGVETPMPDTPVMDEKPPAEQGEEKPDPEVPVEAERPLSPLVMPGPRVGGQSRQQRSLKQIIGEPADYLDEVVIPADVVFVNAQFIRGTAPDKGLKVMSRDGDYQNFQKPGSPFEIVLKSELVESLRARISDDSLRDDYYPAVLKMNIVKDPRGNGFRGVVEWLELLYYIDPIAAKVRVFKDAYYVAHLDTKNSVIGRVSNYKLWHDRIASVTTNVRVRYDKAGQPQIYHDWRAIASHPAKKSDFFHKMIKAEFHH